MCAIDEILSEWYAGEIGGAALFAELEKRAEPRAAGKWLALAQVESRVAGHLAEVLTSLQTPVPVISNAASRAFERCEALAGKSWVETMQWLEEIALAALRKMESDAVKLPHSLTSTGALVLRHEAVLIEFARLEIAGDAERSLRPVIAFLETEITAERALPNTTVN